MILTTQQINPSLRNLIYLAFGILLAGIGVFLSAFLPLLLMQVAALLLLVPAGLWMAIGLCRLLKPLYFSIGFPELPSALRKKASLRRVIWFATSWLFRPFRAIGPSETSTLS